MKVRLIWVGKTKERFARDAVEKYLHLSEPFASIVPVEVREGRGRDLATAVSREGERILKVTSDFVLLGEEGRQLTSKEFAGFLSKRPKWDFVIGGAFGVSDAVKSRAGSTLSLSRMTLPHDLARVVLLEQIYRGLTIIHKRGYHH